MRSHVNSSWSHSAPDEIEEIKVFKTCACETVVLTQGQRLVSADVRRTHIVSQFPVVSCISVILVRQTSRLTFHG